MIGRRTAVALVVAVVAMACTVAAGSADKRDADSTIASWPAAPQTTVHPPGHGRAPRGPARRGAGGAGRGHRHGARDDGHDDVHDADGSLAGGEDGLEPRGKEIIQPGFDLVPVMGGMAVHLMLSAAFGLVFAWLSSEIPLGLVG